MLSQLVLLRGVINAIPDQRDQATLTRVDIDELRHAEMDSFKPVTGLLMARLSTGTRWHYGDRIEIEGLYVHLQAEIVKVVYHGSTLFIQNSSV